MSKIKAIETQYKGYRFRSRLEARWAVFFEALGYEWEYEPEGFDLGNGIYYLPDFRIGDEWYEVKASGRMTAKEIEKIIKFAEHGNTIRLLDGTPDIGNYIGFYLLDGVVETMDERFINKNINRSYQEIANQINRLSDPKERDGDILWWKNCCPYVFAGFTYHQEPGMYRQTLIDAVKKARSARFEHGENPGRY